MNGLWDSTATRSQKWLTAIFLLVLLGALPPIFWRSFAPSDDWRQQAFYLSVVICGACLLGLLWAYKRGQWKPAGPWLEYSRIKRALMIPLCAAFVVVALWINLAMSWPMAYTALLGSETQVESMVEKKLGSGRRSCRHQLDLKAINSFFFEFCVDEEGFHRLPEQPLPALLSVRQSYFGMKVESVRLAIPKEK